jgi:Na+-driven multidrug efflux pump
LLLDWLRLLLASPALPYLFTRVSEVGRTLTAALVVVAAGQVVSGYVFVLDGVLIGAGDAPWLALAMGLLLAYLPLVLGLRAATPWLEARGPVVSIVVLWLGFSVFMGLRAVTLW